MQSELSRGISNKKATIKFMTGQFIVEKTSNVAVYRLTDLGVKLHDMSRNITERLMTASAMP